MGEELGKFTQLNEVDSQILDFKDVLPKYVEQSQIEVNVPIIEKLCQDFNIASLLVTSDFSGPISKMDPAVAGFTPIGHPRLVGYYLQRVPDFSVGIRRVIRVTGPPYIPQSLLFARICLNAQEINRKLLADSRYKGNVRSPAAWASSLDNALKASLPFIARNAGAIHLFQAIKTASLIGRSSLVRQITLEG